VKICSVCQVNTSEYYSSKMNKCKECFKKYQNYRKKNKIGYYDTEKYRETKRQQSKRKYSVARDQVIAHYGAKCKYCGSLTNLQIDHVEGDGALHRKKVHSDKLSQVIIDLGFPDTFQILCKQCNIAKWNRSPKDFILWLKQIISSDWFKSQI